MDPKAQIKIFPSIHILLNSSENCDLPTWGKQAGRRIAVVWAKSPPIPEHGKPHLSPGIQCEGSGKHPDKRIAAQDEAGLNGGSQLCFRVPG